MSCVIICPGIRYASSDSHCYNHAGPIMRFRDGFNTAEIRQCSDTLQSEWRKARAEGHRPIPAIHAHLSGIVGYSFTVKDAR